MLGSGYSGNADGPGTAASFMQPIGIAFAPSGDLFIVDQGSCNVRRVQREYLVTTLAGSGECGFRDGSATWAQFKTPTNIAVDAQRQLLYIADIGNFAVRTVSIATGAVSTLAGNGTVGFADGAGAQAMFGQNNNGNYRAMGIAYDSIRGILFVGDAPRLRAVSIPDGAVSTLAGDPTSNQLMYSHDGIGANASFDVNNGGIIGIAVRAGLVYIAEQHTIRIFNPATTSVVTFVGDSKTKLAYRDGVGTSAIINCAALAFDQKGTLWVSSGSRLFTITPGGATSNLLAGALDTAVPIGTLARFGAIGQIAFDNNDNLLIADAAQNRIFRAAPNGRVSLLAGKGTKEGAVLDFDASALTSKLNWPWGLAVMPSGNILIADADNNKIKLLIVPSAANPLGNVSTIAGNGSTGYVDGPALTNATFTQPFAIAFFGDAYFVLDNGRDMGNDLRGVRLISRGQVTTIPATAGYTFDGFGFSIIVNQVPLAAGPIVYPAGTVFVSQYGRIMVLTDPLSPSAKFVTLVGHAKPPFGTFIADNAPADGPNSTAIFRYSPLGMAWFPSGAFAVTSSSFPALLRSFVNGSLETILDICKSNCANALSGPLYSLQLDYMTNIAIDSHGNMFTTGYGRIIRFGAMKGSACNVSLGTCGSGTYISWLAQTCLPCPPGSTSSMPAYSSYCLDAATGSPFVPSLQGAPDAVAGGGANGVLLGVLLALLAAGLAILAAAGHSLYASRQTRQTRLSKMIAAADQLPSPEFTIDFKAGEISLLGVKSSAAPAVSEAATGAAECVHEIQWSDLVPDLGVRPIIGGFGIVFVARWRSKRKLVAVKVLKSAMLSREQSLDAVQMLYSEAKGLMRASDGGVNEHVVQVFGLAQGKAEGWQGAQRVSRAAEERLKEKKARALQRLNVNTTITHSSGASSSGFETGNAATSGDTAAELGGAESESDAEEGGPRAAAAAQLVLATATALVALDMSRPPPFLFGLVMSFESGGSLQTSLYPRHAGRAAWPSKTVDRLRVAKEIASGLFGLHATHMTHGDLKPDNVMLSSRSAAPHVRLADFGLATVKSSAARATVMSAVQHADEKRGTWPYMAPEMYRSKTSAAAAASRTTDVYAFGTLVHEMLSSRTPWREYSETDRLAALLNGENLDMAELHKDTPASVVALLGRCLALDRSARPRMAEALAVLEQAHENIASGHFVSSARARSKAQR